MLKSFPLKQKAYENSPGNLLGKGKIFLNHLNNCNSYSSIISSSVLLSIPEDTLFDRREEMENFQFNTYIKLPVYVMDIKGFYPYIDELVNNVLKIRDVHMEKAKEIMNRIKPHSMEVMVSIHIRLTDFAKHLKKLWNMKFASDEYFANAMKYFRNKYKVGM